MMFFKTGCGSSVGVLALFSQFSISQHPHSLYQSNPEAWCELYDSPDPLSLALPGGFGAEGRLDAFQRLIMLRCIIPDKLVPAIQVSVDINTGGLNPEAICH